MTTETYEEFAQTLEAIDDEELRFEYILDLAKRHRDDPFPEAWMTDENLMHGCMSKVWIVDQVRDRRHYFTGHSDAAIVKILKSEGLQIARRTVAKYREEMKIPSSSDRKKPRALRS